MSRSINQSRNLRNIFLTPPKSPLTLSALFCVVMVAIFYGLAAAQPPATSTALPPTPFRVNERITYSVTFGKRPNAAYAEVYAASRGRLGERDVVELRSKFKTLDFTNAAFYMLDESRVTFAAADTGLPLYVVRTQTEGVLPKESIDNYLTVPTSNYDLLTLLYQARNTGGTGSYNLQEGDKTYSVSFLASGNERVKTDAGEFDTVISTVQSEFLSQHGIQDMKINFSTDEAKLPVQIRFRTAKGDFRATVASIQMVEPEAESEVAIPVPPRPTATPKPVPTPTPYIDNQPLLPELSFVLGETLEYRISSAGQPVGTIILRAKERKQVPGQLGPQDRLLLEAEVTATTGQGMGLFRVGDTVRSYVNPETLAPQQIDIRFNGAFSTINQTVAFDHNSGFLTFAGVNRIEMPVGTHSILSFIYALRSFNLKPSKNAGNPVNDTRVAVFWDKRPHIFTLRPSEADIITLQGQKVSGQLITVNTGNPQLDMMGLKVWLSNDKSRAPLRFTAGPYQADLVSESVVLPR